MYAAPQASVTSCLSDAMIRLSDSRQAVSLRQPPLKQNEAQNADRNASQVFQAMVYPEYLRYSDQCVLARMLDSSICLTNYSPGFVRVCKYAEADRFTG